MHVLSGWLHHLTENKLLVVAGDESIDVHLIINPQYKLTHLIDKNHHFQQNKLVLCSICAGRGTDYTILTLFL